MDAATTGGPATKSCAVPRTITEKCEATTRAAPSPATGPSGEDRHDRVVFDDQVEAGERRHVGEAHLLERLDAAPAAGPVDEADEGQAQVVRHPFGVDRLLPDCGVGGAAPDGEVVALENRPPPLDPALPDDDVGGQEVGELTLVVVGPLAGQHAGLVEGARVEEAVDALANVQAPGRVLALDPLGAAHLPGELLAVAELGDLRVPTHLVSRLLHDGERYL
jgi:hypothetical protein